MEGPKFFRRLATGGLIVSAAMVLIIIGLRPKDIEIERVSFENNNGQRLVADLYLPRERAGELPWVLLCHGVEVSKEIMSALGVEFAERGFATLAFDYGGFGESDRHPGDLELMVEDTRAALAFLRGLPEVRDDDAGGLIGHSMGVHYSSVLSARDGTISAVVGMGNNHANPNVPPRNLALFMGVYEEFHTLADMEEAARESSQDENLMPNQIAGDFKRGTARALIVSPQAEHGIEPLDPYLIGKAIDWIDRAVPAIEVKPAPVREPYRLIARAILLFSGAAAMGGLFVLWLSGKPLSPVRSRAHLIAAGAHFLIGNLTSPRVTIAISEAILSVILAGGVSVALIRAGNGDLGRARHYFLRGVAVCFILIAAFILSIFAVAVRQAYAVGYLSGIPSFFFHTTLLLTFEGVSIIRADVYHLYSEALIPGIVLSAVLALELIRPGLAALVSSKVVKVILKAFLVNGPFRLLNSKIEAAALGLVIIALGAVLYIKFQEGWLTGEAVKPMLLIMFRAMILPLGLFIGAINIFDRKWGLD